MKFKKCGKCGTEKLLKDFTRNASKPDGRHNYCRTCKKESDKIAYDKRMAQEPKVEPYQLDVHRIAIGF